jgi:CrcB protein
MFSWQNILLVFLGAGIGGVLRFGLLGLLSRLSLTAPWPLMAVNTSGSLFIGVVSGVVMQKNVHSAWVLFLTVGVLGGFTTFSTFSLDVLVQFRNGAVGLALIGLLGNVFLSIGACAFGLWLGSRLA